MEALKIDISKVFGFVPREDIYKLALKAERCSKGTGK